MSDPLVTPEDFPDLFKDHTSYPSQFAIGDPVLVSLQGVSVHGHIRTVTFTSGKVRYSVRAPITEDPGDFTTLHNLDSALVSPNPDGQKVDTPFDNYS